MIHWAAMGMLFRAASWSISFVFLAKGDAKLFFWNELSANIYALVLNILGYHFWGLTGLGVSFLFIYVLYLVQVYVIANKKYAFVFTNVFIKVFTFQVILTIVSFMVVRFIVSPYSYFIGILMIIASTFYTYKELDKAMGLKEFANGIINKYRN
jgi:O-antigen/teichoic acid export membrane protein